MAVQINIGANAGGAVDAIKQIQAAIERAGQAGRQFATLDLSHPELAGMADDIRKLAGRFEDLAKIGRGATATAYRGVAQGSNDPLMWDFRTENTFPDPTERERHRQSVLSYATRGTRWQQPSGAPTPASSGASGNEPAPVAGSGGGGGGIGAMAAGALGGLGGFLAFKALETAKDFAVKSVGLARDEATGTEDLYRHTDMTQNFTDLRDAIMNVTKNLGVTAQEAGALALSFSKVTGETDPSKIATNVRMGIGAGRAYGIDPGVATAAMGQASNAGIDPRGFAILVGEAAAKGGRSVDETMPAMIRLAETSARALIDHLNTNLLQTGGMLEGLNATGLPGMRNGGAEQMMNTLSAGVVNPGGGPAGQAFMYSALARAGITDPNAQRRAVEGGLFQQTPSGGSVFDALRNEAARQFPGQSQEAKDRRADAMENLTGLSMRQWEVMEGLKQQDLSTTFKALSKAGINPANLNETSIADAVRISNADTGGLNDIRNQFLGRHGHGVLSPEDQKTLSDAGPDSLRSALLKAAEKYGQSETEGSKTRDSMAELSNRITELGRGLIDPLNDLKNVESELVGGVAELAQTLSDVYKAGKGDLEAQARLQYGKDGVRGGGGEMPLSDAASKEREAKLMALFQSKEGGGWTREQAAGLTANAMMESGGLAHGPAGDHGHSVGLFQWNEERQLQIFKKFGKRVQDMTLEEQVAAKNWELGPDGPEATAGAALRATTSAYGAGNVEATQDERPANKYAKGVQRGGYAETLLHRDIVPQPFDASHPFATIAPLEVIHRDASGNILGTQSLPVTQNNAPTPHGPARKGDAMPVPPTPPAKAPPPTLASGW